MSIVTGILDIAREKAREAGAEVIRSIEIEVGQLAGVEISALEFSFGIASRAAGLAGAELIIHEVPCQWRCTACGWDADPAPATDNCRGCGEAKLQVVQGRELRVRSITVD